MSVEIPVAPVFEPLLEPARFKGTHGGRGSGKSWFWAGETVDALLSGKNVLCIREIQNSIADSVKRLIEQRISDLGIEAYFTITDKEIACPMSGGVAIFRGMQNHTAASIKSLEGFDIAWWEEAQTASQRSLELLIPTIRKDGSELWFSWNPESEDDPVEFLRKEPPAGAIVIEANWSDNPWFPESLRADMERDRARDPDKYAHVWEGKYRNLSEARIFRNWQIGELTPPERVYWHYGADFGFANDPTAALRCCRIGPSILYVDHESGEVGCPVERTPHLLNKVPDFHKWPSRGDSSRPETIDYLRRNGIPKMRPAKKGPGSVEDGIMFLQSFNIVVHPRCVNLAKELASYAYKTDRHTGEILPIPEDANNHWIDALRYAVERLHLKGKLLPEMEPDEDDRRRRPSDEYGYREEDADSWKVV